MNKSSRTTRKLSTVKLGAILLAIIVIAGAVFFIMKLTTPHKQPVAAAPTTSKQPTAQSNFAGGDPKTATKTTPDNTDSYSTDTKGSVSTVPPSSQWTTSKDGSSIVVYGPANNAVFASGDTLFGTAKSNAVFYELEDSVSGVIAQGQATVVNGHFSAKFNFSTTATNGKLNIFNQADDGTESNNVTINVRFK